MLDLSSLPVARFSDAIEARLLGIQDRFAQGAEPFEALESEHAEVRRQGWLEWLRDHPWMEATRPPGEEWARGYALTRGPNGMEEFTLAPQDDGRFAILSAIRI